MIEEDVDLVAGDFNGAGWRRKVGAQQQNDSALEESLRNARLPLPFRPTLLWTGVSGFCEALPIGKTTGLYASMELLRLTAKNSASQKMIGRSSHST